MKRTTSAGFIQTDSSRVADAANTQFYQRFPYPWPPMKFSYLTDQNFETVMLNQNIGDWQQRTLPKHPRIWVAGCGTNQAIFTALRFPEGKIIASDLSQTALKTSATIAQELHISNVELREESINQVSYKEEFDHIICTGVIHHNADPAASLLKLTAALKPGGVLELMVYNEYHRITIQAFQKAIGLLCKKDEREERQFEQETRHRKSAGCQRLHRRHSLRYITRIFGLSGADVSRHTIATSRTLLYGRNTGSSS